jgi:hypothetical protein
MVDLTSSTLARHNVLLGSCRIAQQKQCANPALALHSSGYCITPGSQPDRLWPFALDPPSDGAEPPKACLGEGAEMLNFLHRKAGHAREFDDL